MFWKPMFISPPTSTSKTADKKIQRQHEIHEACQSYLNASQTLIYKAEETLKDKVFASTCPMAKIAYIQQFIVDGKRQMDQIKRRILDNEKIPHHEYRYADDGVVHCYSEAQAKSILEKLKIRFQECGLELHPQI